ncbi:unnamed protein product [Urochloa decumbens]|uniref:F-box domain-containing protein n=1 Tax=Urochloa decumbens TaxID=240449 RepID=A0ABC9AWE7_9POAL
MPPGKAHKVSAAGGDLIGALPDALLLHILSFLPAQQAARTCVLARRWIDLWKSATGLRIVGADGESPVRFGDVWEFVDHLLLFCGCSPLEECEFRFVELSDGDVPRMNLWIRHALMCKVRVLRILVHRTGAAPLKPEDLHVVSQHLTRLNLGKLLFNKFLDFSRCPSLQDLWIGSSNFVHVDRISSVSKAPNDRKRFFHHDDYGNCCYESCKSCMQNDDSCLLLQGLSQAKNLCLIADAKTFVFRRDLKWCQTFTQLKNCVLNEHWCVPDVRALAFILEHSPVLEGLYLILFSKGPKHNVEMKGSFNPKELPCTISAQLKRVEVKCAGVDERVVEVLRFLSKLNISLLFHEKMV